MSDEFNTVQSPEPEGGHRQSTQPARRSLPALDKLRTRVSGMLRKARGDWRDAITGDNKLSLLTHLGRECALEEVLMEIDLLEEEEPEGNNQPVPRHE